MKLTRFFVLTAALSFAVSVVPGWSARPAGAGRSAATPRRLSPVRGSGTSVAAQAGVSMVAVLRRDGTIIPFANWNGRRWSTSWPAASLTIEVPITLESVPRGWWPDDRPETSWTAWPIGGEPRPINVKAPLAIGQHCDMNVGLSTDYRSDEPVPPVKVQPYP
ncbi:MAG: hypothetical protein EHM13_07165, partial [Acidobacteria bacterium]